MQHIEFYGKNVKKNDIVFFLVLKSENIFILSVKWILLCFSCRIHYKNSVFWQKTRHSNEKTAFFIEEKTLVFYPYK